MKTKLHYPHACFKSAVIYCSLAIATFAFSNANANGIHNPTSSSSKQFTEVVSPVDSSQKAEILLISGKFISARDVLISDIGIQYVEESKRLLKYKYLSLDEVFSVTYESGEEVIVYVPDTTISNSPSVAEMRYYMKGEQLAREKKTSRLTFGAGIVIGAVSAFQGFWYLPVPVVYTIVVHSLRPKSPENVIEQPANGVQSIAALPMKIIGAGFQPAAIPIDNPNSPDSSAYNSAYYNQGYYEATKSIRATGAMKGAFVGYVTVLIYSLFIIL